MTEQFQPGQVPSQPSARPPINWRRLVRHGPGHLVRWVWLVALYVVIVSYTFGAIGAWQFQDRIREVAGDRAGANSVRQQLVRELRESQEAQTTMAESLSRLGASLTTFEQYVNGIGEHPAAAPVERGEVLPEKDVPFELLDRIQNGELVQRISALQSDLAFFRDLAVFREAQRYPHLDAYLLNIGMYLGGNGRAEAAGVAGNRREHAAVTLLAEYLTAGNLRSWLATPFFYVPGQQDVPRQLATWSEGHLTLLLTLLMGALGSLLYVSRAYLDWAFKGARWTEPAPLPLSWFIFRPMFGMITALAILILIKAGQLGFSSGTTFSLEEGSVNPFLIGFVAIIAGLMSWQCLELIESVGGRWLESARRRDLWATGLENALAVRGKSLRALADQIGRSERQVERWILLKDKVIPEMQDRIAAWLQATRTEMFGDETPRTPPERPSRRASKALREAAVDPAAVDPAALARRLGESAEDCKAWLNGAKPMPPAAQDVLADWLDRPIAELFEEATSPPPTSTPAEASGVAPPTPPAPAKLDKILAEKQKTGQALSERLGLEVETAQKWLAGEEQVPPDLRARIAVWLGVEETDIHWG
jgi:transcriptional regulator with XRE-family HTH domain